MANIFIISGQTFSIKKLDPVLDREFVNLHGGLLGALTYGWEAFVTAAHTYFSQPEVSGHQHGLFFNNFTILWKHFLHSGQFDGAERVWEMACRTSWDWEKANQGKLIHKGTAYYFWGMTAILRGDIDRGYALMHQALEEDVRTNGNPFPNTPALALATMNAEMLEQAFHGWVARKASVANIYLTKYRASTGKSLTFALLNSKFLQHPPNRHTVYSLSYVLARLVKLNDTPPLVLVSDFAAQLNMELNLRLLQVIESSLKAKNPAGKTFLPLAVYLSKAASLTLTQADLEHVNAEAKKDFERTMGDLLDGKFAMPNGSRPSGLSRDLAVAYACRNYGTHQLAPSATVLSRADEIRQAVFDTFFITVETLY